MASSVRSAGVLGGLSLLLLICLAHPSPSDAQVWTRTTKVIAPITSGGPLYAFLDTLQHVEAQRAGITVRRSPDQASGTTLSALRDTLQNRYGLDVASADYVIAGYQFSITGGDGFKWKLTDLHYLYRGTDETDDISILYLDPSEKWIQSVLRNRGLALQTNQAAFVPFREYYSFVYLTQLEETDVIEIGGQTVREGFDAEKQALIQQVHHLTYSDVY